MILFLIWFDFGMESICHVMYLGPTKNNVVYFFILATNLDFKYRVRERPWVKRRLLGPSSLIYINLSGNFVAI
jgi:hypothetical protein